MSPSGPISDLGARIGEVRFTPVNGPCQLDRPCQFRATNGHPALENRRGSASTKGVDPRNKLLRCPGKATQTIHRVTVMMRSAAIGPIACYSSRWLPLEGAGPKKDLCVTIRDEKEGDMRPIITTTIVALTIAIAPVAKAQQADNQTMQATEAMVAKWTQAVNQGDSKTASSFFTSDAFGIDVYGRTSGAQMGELTKKVHDMGIDLTNKVNDVRSLASGQVLLASGTFAVSYRNNPNLKPGDTVTGNWMRVLVKEGSDWKIAAQSLTRQAPPMPSATTGSSSTNK
jgi:ketosteroid isomerase-like protein